jgi:hypothetical protein
VQMANHRPGAASAVYLAPECRASPARTKDLSRAQLETAHLYSLGIVLYFAADYKLAYSEHPELSPALEEIIAKMVHERPEERCSLDQVRHMLIARAHPGSSQLTRTIAHSGLFARTCVTHGRPCIFSNAT